MIDPLHLDIRQAGIPPVVKSHVQSVPLVGQQLPDRWEWTDPLVGASPRGKIYCPLCFQHGIQAECFLLQSVIETEIGIDGGNAYLLDLTYKCIVCSLIIPFQFPIDLGRFNDIVTARLDAGLPEKRYMPRDAFEKNNNLKDRVERLNYV